MIEDLFDKLNQELKDLPSLDSNNKIDINDLILNLDALSEFLIDCPNGLRTVCYASKFLKEFEKYFNWWKH